LKTQFKNTNVAKPIDGFVINAYPDFVDFRDYIYEPPLIQIKNTFKPSLKTKTLNQGKEGACTGFGLATAINTLNKKRGNSYIVSPRMLYELGRRFDEWPGNDYSGSSCRGAIKGWYAMGVCREAQWPFKAGIPGHLSVERAKKARENRVGAYYRLNHRIADFHAAINETGTIFCSARVHRGWQKKEVRENKGQILFQSGNSDTPGHAFAVVGYNEDGFLVQNSWGSEWGKSGVALWAYEDWFENIRDAWVFRLSLSTKAIWQVSTREKPRTAESSSVSASGPVRSEIAGHFVHIDDGEFERHGSYWSDFKDVQETASLLEASDKYDHLLLYAHGGLVTPKSSATRIRAMAPVFKKNRIYPYHFMYDTGLAEELKDVLLRTKSTTEKRVGSISDWTDPFFEKTLRKPGRALWREMKQGAEVPFFDQRAGIRTLEALTTAVLRAPHPKHIHIVGHSLGSVLVAHMLEAIEKLMPTGRIKSVSLMAPAATESLFKTHYYPYLKTKKAFFGIDNLNIYNLNDELEKKDNVMQLYRKSLLCLVSRAFEEQVPGKLLGLQEYSVKLDRIVGKAAHFHYSDGSTRSGQRTSSLSHGGFDNDKLTMNDVMKTVLGKKPLFSFTDNDLDF